MAFYQPPIPLNQGKFNPAGYEDPTGSLTIEEANTLFLRFPTAQGTENFGDVNVVGTLTAGTFSPINITADTASLDITNTGDIVLAVPTTKAIQFQVASFPKMTLTETTNSFEVLAGGDILFSVSGYEKLAIDETITDFKDNDVIISGTGKLSTTNPDTYGTTYGYETSQATSGNSIHNTAFGYQTGKGLINTTGNGGNTAFGAIALTSITGASTNNTAIGHNALWGITTGDGNTQVGMTTTALAGNLTTANNNTLIGHNASVSGTGITTSTAIGYNAQATASNEIVLGTTSETVRYNIVSPLYTTVPTYTSANIGFVHSATITYPGATTNNIISYGVSVGSWLCCISLCFNAGTGCDTLTLKDGATILGFVPKTKPAGITNDLYVGTIPLVITSTTKTITLVPLSAPSVGTNGGFAGQFVRFIRIA